MKGVKIYESQRIEGEHSNKRTESITEEKPLRILINNEPFTVTMRTPGDDKELAIGLLYSEDVIRTIENLSFEITEDDIIDSINIAIPESAIKDGYMNARNFLSISSCGVCGKTSLPIIEGDILSQNTVSKSTILNGFTNMLDHQIVFEQTGGCHAAAILNSEGEIISIAEDIGRHNAVDKVIGKLLLSGNLQNGTSMLVSGRVSYEIIIKSFRAKIPTLAAVSAPSSLAIDYAKELGITLFAFCRKNRITRFS